ncbi:hypothetical protein [Conexibacter woesei]|uniref:hypothetical protein n=1 Tax=Conexibacter woesei TaxID=191495 RepID=UPI0012DEB159|nr:hypothetical protein [Conexibacter woesei]
MASAAVKKRAAQARRQQRLAATHGGPDPVAPKRPAPSERGGLPQLSPRQALWAGVAGLVLIALLVYGWYIRHAGLWDDDWAVTSAVFRDRADGGGYWDGIRELWATTAWRPVLVVYGGVLGPLGWHTSLHSLVVIAMTTTMLSLLYQVLRVRGIGSPHAFAIAALALVTWFGDSGVLWISGGAIRLAGVFYLAGLLMALSALRQDDQRAALRRHIGAGVLYLLAVLTYESTAGFLWAGVLVYLGVGPNGRVLRRWGVDLAISAAGLAWAASHTPRPTHSLSDDLDHARAILRGYWQVYDGIVSPSWLPDHTAGVLTLVALAIGAGFLIARAAGRAAGPGVDAICRWGWLLVIGVVYIAAAYVVFVPGDAYYVPNVIGESNRFNALAGAPSVLVGYAAVMVLVTSVLALRRDWLKVALAVGLLYALGMGITSARTVRADQHTWASDYEVSKGLLAEVRQNVPHPARGTYVVTFGVPALEASGNPVFYSSWDLSYALRHLYRDGSLGGFNAYNGAECTPNGLAVAGATDSSGYSTADASAGDGGELTARYGRTIAVDTLAHRAYPLTDERACARALRTIGTLVTPTPGIAMADG